MVTKENGGNKNAVPMENATYPMDSKKINKTVLQEADTTRSLINNIHKRKATFFGHIIRREKPKYSCNHWNNRRKMQ